MPSRSAAAIAQPRLRARARRINRVRKRVAAVALATFALAFGVISDDVSMGATTPTTSQTTAVATTTAGATSMITQQS